MAMKCRFCTYTTDKGITALDNHAKGLHVVEYADIKRYLAQNDITAKVDMVELPMHDRLPVDVWMKR